MTNLLEGESLRILLLSLPLGAALISTVFGVRTARRGRRRKQQILDLMAGIQQRSKQRGTPEGFISLTDVDLRELRAALEKLRDGR